MNDSPPGDKQPDESPADENKLIAERRHKLAAIRAQGGAFPNDFRRDTFAADLLARYAAASGEQLEAQPVAVKVAGRLMAKRVMGKASFAQIQDPGARIQLFLQQSTLGESYEAFKGWDVGDIVGAAGVLFRTKTGELTVKLSAIRLLTKSLRPLPDKWHGLADTELRYRQRYVDLIMNEDSRKLFTQRSAVIRFLREYLDRRDFLEVETPMMQPIPGGAAARPFKTWHNALGVEMFMRIAPELYLKRLVVGGFEKVYEINRNFRNEGLSTRHNPEFTMLELYWAYADYHDLMNLVEDLIRGLAARVLGQISFESQGQSVNLEQPFARLSVAEVILRNNPGFDASRLRDLEYLRAQCANKGIACKQGDGAGKLQIELFEKTGEHTLQEPTFVYAYPAEVSPLSRANDQDPFLTDRFEFFAGGRELANGFSELNDAEDQAARFRAQVARKDAGDDEAMFYDADYVRALEYGMPPTAGLGIGVDRLVMWLTNAASIRDVLLFPQMRPDSD
jgi:lysyl-tRNA synthetase, class II